MPQWTICPWALFKLYTTYIKSKFCTTFSSILCPLFVDTGMRVYARIRTRMYAYENILSVRLPLSFHSYESLRFVLLFRVKQSVRYWLSVRGIANVLLAYAFLPTLRCGLTVVSIWCYSSASHVLDEFMSLRRDMRD